MNTTVTAIIAITLYLLAGGILAVRLFGRLAADHPLIRTNRNGILVLASAAIVVHAMILYEGIFSSATGALNFGFYTAVSLVLWMIATLLTIGAFSKPVDNLCVVVLPSAAFALALDQLFPSSHILLAADAAELRYHIVISIMAYSTLSIAALQSVLLAIQDKYLRAKHPGGFIRAFPPLETMESLLFQMIGVGFAFLSLSLLTGLPQIEDMFAQHQVHKTVLSITAWGFFAVLLWGRWRFGWRGRTAVRWAIGGFVVLLLAYFGVKLVKELLLGR